jgi:PAS domain S-box-containing protein
LPIGIIIFIDSKIVFCNDRAGSILGALKYQELIGEDAKRFIQPEQHDFYMERLGQAQAGEPVPLCEQVYVRLDGSEVEVEEMAFSFLFRNQQASQVIFRDITEKKSAEATIRKNETLFTQLFNSIPMATVMLDGAGKVLQINSGFREMFGYELEELKGKNLNDHIVPDELRNEGIDLNNLIHASRVISVETIRKHKQGKVVNVILYGVPVMQDLETIGIYGVYVDITDRRKVEDELKIRNAELDNFVYKVSHDLRAPLSSILGLVNLAKVPGNTDDMLDYIDIIGNKVEHLDGFISDVLSHSKNLKVELSVNQINLRGIIENSFTDLNYLQGAKEMIKHVKVEGVEFYSDPWRISEIFRNLISNAVKYRQMDGSRQPEISIKIHVDNLRADISFADNGIGITEENLNRIFEMFFRATEQSDGSGIGLYIVKNAVDKLGGQISVASKSGLGTRFNIILPNRISSSPITKSYPILAEVR